jgi:opacity protein-like surface antigen
MKLAHFAVALALSAATALPAAAQAPVSEPGMGRLTPFVSLTFGGDGRTSSLGLGGAAGYDITEVLSLEAELAYVFDLMGDSDEIDLKVLTGAANVLYHFPLENGITPYATAGLGFARVARDTTRGDVSSTEVGFNFGGGVKIPLTEGLAARGDFRHFAHADQAPDGFRIYGGLTWRVRR